MKKLFAAAILSTFVLQSAVCFGAPIADQHSSATGYPVNVFTEKQQAAEAVFSVEQIINVPAPAPVSPALHAEEAQNQDPDDANDENVLRANIDDDEDDQEDVPAAPAALGAWIVNTLNNISAGLGDAAQNVWNQFIQYLDIWQANQIIVQLAGPTPLQQQFAADYQYISDLPYIGPQFNCNFSSACLASVAALNGDYAYQTTIVYTATQPLPTGIAGPPDSIFIAHQVVIVWGGTTEDGLFDIYGFFEPQSGTFVGNNFIVPASNSAPTIWLPQFAIINYAQNSDFHPPDWHIQIGSQLTPYGYLVFDYPSLAGPNWDNFSSPYVAGLALSNLTPAQADQVITGLEDWEPERPRR